MIQSNLRVALFSKDPFGGDDDMIPIIFMGNDMVAGCSPRIQVFNR